METVPLVTVLMPVYNGSLYLKEAVSSILSQTFSDFELLVIDDGSTDATAGIIRSFADPRIRLIVNAENLGITRSLNKGIAMAAAPLIARMDADDISHPERLQLQYDLMTAHPEVAMVSAWVRVIDGGGREQHCDTSDPAGYYYFLTYVCSIYHPAVMYRRDAVLAIGGYTALFAEDFELFWQLTRRFPAAHISSILVDYRVSSQSLHQVTRKKEYEDAQHAQVNRNIGFYATKDYCLSYSQVEALRYQFAPLLREGSVRNCTAMLHALKSIAADIAESGRPFVDRPAVQKAAADHYHFIASYFMRNLPPNKGIALTFRTGGWRIGWQLVRASLRKRLRATVR